MIRVENECQWMQYTDPVGADRSTGIILDQSLWSETWLFLVIVLWY